MEDEERARLDDERERRRLLAQARAEDLKKALAEAERVKKNNAS
jgi:hypothetical protein